MRKISRFVIIDDDPIHNRLCVYLINTIVPAAEVISFTNASRAFSFIKMAYTYDTEIHWSVILLNIHMPGMDGWEFLENYQTLDDHARMQLAVYIVSASLNPDHKARAVAYPYVKDYLLKPVTEYTVRKIMNDFERTER